MPQTARIKDEHRGICNHGAPCCPHEVAGTIIAGSLDVYVNGLRAARLNDEVEHDCPHCGTGFISSGSQTVLVNGLPIARLGDSVTYPGGGGTITTASGNVLAGG